MKRTPLRSISRNPVAKLKAKLDRVFSEFIRRRHGRYPHCFTCGKRLFWKNAHCGHFHPRNHLGTRWDEVNCQVQCVGCNIFANGRLQDFGYRLLTDFGKKEFDRLFELKNGITKFTPLELQKKIEYYQDKIKEL